MSNSRVPITRIGKFFGAEDYSLDLSMGEEWLHGDMNFTLVLYRIDRIKTKTDNIYGETVSDGVATADYTAQLHIMTTQVMSVYAGRQINIQR